jgi:hypothetical protein
LETLSKIEVTGRTYGKNCPVGLLNTSSMLYRISKYELAIGELAIAQEVQNTALVRGSSFYPQTASSAVRWTLALVMAYDSIELRFFQSPHKHEPLFHNLLHLSSVSCTAYRQRLRGPRREDSRTWAAISSASSLTHAQMTCYSPTAFNIDSASALSFLALRDRIKAMYLAWSAQSARS